MPSPYSYNMAAAARYLAKPHGKTIVLALGDSAFTETSYPRLFGGVMRAWDTPFAGLYLPYIGTAWEGYWDSANTTNITNTTRVPGDAFADATVNRYPQAGREMVWAANTPNSNNININFISSKTNYLRGDWIGSNPVQASMIYRRTTNSPSGFVMQACRDGSTQGSAITFDMSGSDSFQIKTITFPTGSTTSSDAFVVIKTGTGSEDETGKHAYLFGGWLEATDANQEGLRFASIAQGGWTTLNHLDPTVDATNGKYDDTNLDLFLTHIGANSAARLVILVQLGQNTATGEVSGSATTGVYTTNIQAVLSRYRSAAARIGAPDPLFILRTIWQGESGTGARYTSQADIQYALAQANSDIGFVNLNRLVSDTHGAYSTWSSKYLADAVHPTEAGTVEFERLFWQQIMRDSAAADSPTVVEIRQEIDANSTQLAALTTRIPSALTITGGKVDVNDKTGFSLSAAGLQAFWDALKSSQTTANSMGKLLVDTLDAAISSRAAPGALMGLIDGAITAAKIAQDAKDAIAVAVESHLLDEGDSQPMINAIVEAIGNVNMDQVVLVAALRADLERSGGSLATILTNLALKLAAEDYVPPDNDVIAQAKASADAAKASADAIPGLILLTPANKLLTNAQGQVEASNLPAGDGDESINIDGSEEVVIQ